MTTEGRAYESPLQTQPRSSPRAAIHEMVNAVHLARAVFVVAELGIADLLRDGARNVDELAELSRCHADSLRRVLRLLASCGVFVENEQGCFDLTALANVLRSDVPDSLLATVRMWDEPRWRAWGDLLHSVRTGEPAFDHVHGMGIFEYRTKHPESQARFDAAMANISEAENLVIARDYDFGRFEQVIDVGGGRGGLIAEILKVHTSVRGMLFDQPQVVEHPTYLVSGGVRDRCQTESGNMFASVPEGGDAYVLKRVLHDWDDVRCVALLRNCRNALAPGGHVLTIDTIVPPGNDPHPSKTIDIAMLLIGGRERTEEEFRRLYGEAGLNLTRIVPTMTRTAMAIIDGTRA